MTTVTTLEEANAELTLRLRQQELAAAFATFSLGTDELQPVLDEVCRAASRGMECTLAKVLEFLPDEDCFVMRAGVGWQPGTVGTARLGSDLASPAGFAFQTGQPVLSNHLAKETRFRTPQLLVDHGVHRAFNVLVHTPGWRFGVLEVDSPDERDFTLSDTAFLQALAATLAEAIGKARRIQELRRSEAFVQGVMEASPDCIKVLSVAGTLEYMNHRGLEMNELASWDDVRGREFAAMWPEAEQDAVRRAVTLATEGQIAEMAGYCPTATGKPRWWDLKFAPYAAEDGRPVQVIAISRDISDRRAAEEALRTLNETLEEEVETRTRERDRLWRLSEDLLVIAEYGGRLVRVSPSWTRLLGYDQATLGATPYQELIHPEDRRLVAGIIDQMRLDGQPARYENRVSARDGTWRWISWTLSPEPGSDRLMGVGRDVTAEKEEVARRERLEEQLRQSQKMEAVGQLTGGLAHDFNNLLTGIVGSLELLGTRIGQGRLQGLERYIAAAQGASSRAAALTHRLLAFSRRQTLAPKPVESNRLVVGMSDMIRRTAGPSVEFRVAEAPSLWITRCDPNQLENALLNLCINARDAMPGGGILTVATGNADIHAGVAGLRDMPEGQYVSLSVTDTGAGMPPDVVARAFDPFFTTKPLGQGTGLGLSMIYGFVKQSGGQVRIHSTEGMGTTVTIYLPRFRGQAEADEVSVDLAAVPRADAGETVLVVDDESTIRMLLTEVLEDLGYAAVEAADGVSGLKVLQSDIRIDLLVTDVGLPGGMNGRQMADAARTVRPDLKVLFVTGYAEGAGLDESVLGNGMQVMTKPFAMEALALRIRSMITA